ncbi:ParB N-terminal domain-containing protein [Streptomyces sp. NPDC052020]|uniref:ParB/RepB/Spo0J family partition protein n=1 Tax=Streptomyces sp. NPDC052020 TaxID=3155677 RepID=UPI0034324CD7
MEEYDDCPYTSGNICLGAHDHEDDVIDVPVRLLRPGDSPRSAGSSMEHAQMLARVGADLPPILVHRPSMRVIDGMHRFEAAQIRGEETIKARFVDGDEEQIFVLAVEMNTKHGLPLTLADRKAAARRIITANPHWSDRAVAAKAGLSHKTVGALRRATGEIPQLPSRVGLDGRARAVRPREQVKPGGRATERPRQWDATVALQAQNRQLTKRIEEAEPRRRTNSDTSPSGLARRDHDRPGQDWLQDLQRLRTDPSLRYSEAGRVLLRVLDAHVAAAGQLHRIAEVLPEHCLDRLTTLAFKCAEDLREFSVRLSQRKSELG